MKTGAIIKKATKQQYFKNLNLNHIQTIKLFGEP